MARTGMTDLIDTLRGMSAAGTGDFTVGSIIYWADNEVQKVLDRHRADIVRNEAAPVESYNNGTVVYLEYRLGYGNLEQGTAYFELEDAAGTTLGTALYSADYARGIVSFVSDTTGSSVFFTGRAYDLNGAAADIWRVKAAHVADWYDFSTDNHRLSRSQVMRQCLDMAGYYEGYAAPTVIQLYREDNLC